MTDPSALKVLQTPLAEIAVLDNRLLFWLALPLTVACDGLVRPEPLLQATVASITAPDTVAAATAFTADVRVTHGPCQRPIPPQVSYVADTAFLDARVQRDDRVFNGVCDADILLSQVFDVAISPPGLGRLVLRPRPQPGATQPADTVIVASP